jgi:hypothetical protein
VRQQIAAAAAAAAELIMYKMEIKRQYSFNQIYYAAPAFVIGLITKRCIQFPAGIASFKLSALRFLLKVPFGGGNKKSCNFFDRKRKCR